MVPHTAAVSKPAGISTALGVEGSFLTVSAAGTLPSRFRRLLDQQ
jgi:hypothetical protein